MPSLFASYLRVYEPLTAFDRDRQVFWRRYAREGRALGLVEGPVKQRTAVLEALGAGWTRLPDLPDEAYVLERDDALLICPWNLRLRVAEAALNARDGVPACWPTRSCRRCWPARRRAVVDDWRSGAKVLEQGVPRVHEQIATWGVPLRWFVFVDLDEREISLTGRRRALRYRTEISKARRRAHRGLSVLRKSLGDAPITRGGRGEHAVAGGVPSRGRWSSSTTADWSALLPDDVLNEDDSPGLVAAGLAALSRGDADAATEAYEKLVARWRAVQLLERCN